jgi:hypothetical protein
LDQKIRDFHSKVTDESYDLSVIDTKVVKTARIDEIYRILETIKLSSEDFEDGIDKQVYQLRQLESDIDAFMVKTRSSNIYECEARVKKLEEILKNLIKKLSEVNSEIEEF